MDEHVDLVVVNYQQEALLARCLESLLRLDYPPERRHVVVVDNASRDGSCAIVKERFPSVELIALGRNVGFGPANNVAIQATRSPFVALVNNDVFVEPSWLSAMVEACREPSVGSATAKVLFDTAPARIQNVGVRLLANGSCADRGSWRGAYELDEGQYERAEDVFSFCGAAALLKREMLDGVGLFDERFFMYYEDVDLAWRARARGWRHRYVPGAVCHHRHAASSREWSPLFVRNVTRNRLLMLMKNASSRMVVRGLVSAAAENAGYWMRTLKATAKLQRSMAMLRFRQAVSHSDGLFSALSLLPAALVARNTSRTPCIVLPRDVERAWVDAR